MERIQQRRLLQLACTSFDHRHYLLCVCCRGKTSTPNSGSDSGSDSVSNSSSDSVSDSGSDSVSDTCEFLCQTVFVTMTL